MVTLAQRTTGWAEACDVVVDDLLHRTGVIAPPVDAFELADDLGLTVAFDTRQAGRGRIKRIAGNRLALLKPEERPERMQWSLAHEIGESVVSRVFDIADAAPDADQPYLREQVANEFASRLLLPNGWFIDDARACGCDLFQLKECYNTASHELIAMALLRQPKITVVTVIDEGRVTRRRGNGMLNPPAMLPIEREAQRIAHMENRPVERHDDSLLVQAWPVHEPGHRRELLRSVSLIEPEMMMEECW